MIELHDGPFSGARNQSGGGGPIRTAFQRSTLAVSPVVTSSASL